MAKPLRVGVIGCGNISRFHFSGLSKAGATVAWVCDLNEAAARPWAEKLGARASADYREVLADPQVELVDITTISKVHKEICLAAIASGKAVICEKTLAHPLNKVGFLRDGWDERVEINGVHGRLELFSALWDQPEYKASLLVHTDNRTGRATEYRYAPESPFDRALVFFCDNVRRGVQGSQARSTGYDVDELIAHIQQSAAMRQAVDLTWRL